MSLTEKLLSPLRSARRKVLYPHDVPLAVHIRDRDLATTWKRVNELNLTYSTPRQLNTLVELVQRAERLKEPGEIIETGCAYGGSAILMCAAKSRHRPLRVFDIFGMLPEPTEADGADMQQRYREIAAGESKGLGGNRHYAYETDLEAKVRGNFAQLGFPIEENAVTLTRGKVQETLQVHGPVCLAHIDVDWFEPVTASLERIVPNLTPHGSVVLRAYASWSGCRKATDEYFDRVGRDGFTFRTVDGELVVGRRTPSGLVAGDRGN